MFALILVLLPVIVTAFIQNCGIHESHVKGPRRFVIPQTTEFGDQESWLPTTNEEILRYYNVGLVQCNDFLFNKSSQLLSQKYPPPYQPHEEKPIGGQSLCRGNSMLYGLAGVVLWRFGPILS